MNADGEVDLLDIFKQVDLWADENEEFAEGFDSVMEIINIEIEDQVEESLYTYVQENWVDPWANSEAAERFDE